MTLSKLRVVLEASVGGFNRAIRSSGRVLGSMLAGVKSLTTGLFSLGTAFKAMLAVMAVRRLAMVSKAVFDMGAAVAETQSKFDTTFGAASKQVQAFINDFANMAGLTQVVAQDMSATTGAILQGMGLTQQAAADLTAQVVTLAGDFASYNNLRTEDTLHAVTSALVGEREQLKRLAVVLLEADVQQRAMIDNRLASTKAITQEMKVLASVALMTEKAGVQLGDLVRTQNSAANRAKQLGAAWLDLRNTAATLLQPAFIGILDAVAQSEVSFANWNISLKENAATIVGWSAVALKSFQAFGAAAMLLPKTFIEVMGFIGDVLRGNFTMTMAQLEARFLELVNTLSVGLLEVTNLELDMVEAFNRAINAFNDAARDAEAAFTPLELTIGTIIEQVSALDNVMVGFANNFADRVGGATRSSTQKIDSLRRALEDMIEKGVSPASEEYLKLAAALETAVEWQNRLKDAFKGFIDDVIADLTRLAAKMLIFRSLQFLFPDSNFVSALGSSLGIASGGGGGAASLGPTLTGSETGFSGPLTSSSRAAPAAPVFNQNVNFNISTVDAAGVDAVIRQQAGTIVAVVAEAAQSSSALRRALSGG